MENDLTYNILVSPLWLLGGLLAYFLITLMKVHIILEVQPRIYNATKNVFKNWFANFLKSLVSNTKLLMATFKYLFHYSPKDFLVIKTEEAKSTKKVLNILDGITVFLKPYLLFALFWSVLEFYISKKLFYDESKITLGEIQKSLLYIKSIPFVAFLQKKKALILLVYAIICVLIPFLYDREASTNTAKRYFTRGLIYLSLLAHISFFGSEIGKTTSDKSHELSELQTVIVDIHDNIYKQLVTEIEFNDLRDEVEKQEKLYKEEINRFESLIESIDSLQIDTIIKKDLESSLLKYNKALKVISTIEYSYVANINTVPKIKGKSPSAYFSEYFDSHFKSNGTYGGYTDYLSNKSLWNKANGKKVAQEVKNIVKNESAVTSVFDKKLRKVLNSIFDFGLDASVTEVFDYFKIERHKTLKKLVNLILQESNYKKTVTERVFSILNWAKSSPKYAKEIFKTKMTPFQSVSSAEFYAFSESNNAYFLKKENYSIAKNIQQKINDFDIVIPKSSEIIQRLNEDIISKIPGMPQITTESEAIDFLNIINERSGINYKFNPDTDLSENIFKMERDAYIDVVQETYGSIDLNSNKSLKDYNKLLYNQTSNLTLMNASGLSNLSNKICPRCGLPYAFPICLAKSIRRR